ncbi:MAG: hypothetical protein LBU14_00700 [Candidatus Peribacteria bacterium]|nr:hypothetical protein [Candidatus Peribacteria bacterium]
MIFQDIDWIFSIWSAKSVRDLFNKPIFSPDFIIQTSELSKSLGNNSIQSDNFLHSFNSKINLHKILFKIGSLSCFSRIETLFNRETQAFVIVDKSL